MCAVSIFILLYRWKCMLWDHMVREPWKVWTASQLLALVAAPLPVRRMQFSRCRTRQLVRKVLAVRSANVAFPITVVWRVTCKKHILFTLVAAPLTLTRTQVSRSQEKSSVATVGGFLWNCQITEIVLATWYITHHVNGNWQICIKVRDTEHSVLLSRN